VVSLICLAETKNAQNVASACVELAWQLYPLQQRPDKGASHVPGLPAAVQLTRSRGRAAHGTFTERAVGSADADS
jgi:hypothetical protein